MMLTYIQAIILGAVQGATELFPVSSLGHSVIVPGLFRWDIDQGAEGFLIFLVATHLATSVVLFVFFWKDWVRIIKGVVLSIWHRRIDPTDPYAKVGWLIVVATVPAGALGFVFQHKLQVLFASPIFVSFFLILNGFVLYGAEILRKRVPPEAPIRLSWSQSIKIGCAQALALIPGFSRTGAALGGGLIVGLDHESAARFSFLLATPIIFAAAVLKLPGLFTGAIGPGYPIGAVTAGALTAAIGAYASVKFLTRYFQTKTLVPFATYCVAVGIVCLAIFIFRS